MITITKLWWLIIRRWGWRWARRDIDPCHDDLPLVVLTLRELDDEIEKLYDPRKFHRAHTRTAASLPRLSQKVRPHAARSEARNDYCDAEVAY